MRFGDLAGQTSLPIEFVEQRFRNEDVLTVLPVREELARRETLLVATSLNLAIVTADADPSSHHWMTRWTPWYAVKLVVEDEVAPTSGDDEYGLTVHVGGLTFHSRLPGKKGQRALREFVLATQAGQEALVPSGRSLDPLTGGHREPRSP